MTMSNDSPLFDRIRVKPDKDRRLRAELPGCNWPGCDAPATHRAPKGRERANEYWRFCLEHVREYNSSYNFFSGMTDDAVARYQKDALTGHRPTWKLGANGGTKGKSKADEALGGATDPFHVFSELNGRGRWRGGPDAAPETRPIFNAERK